MSDYTPNTESVRKSIVHLAKYHAERQHCDADLVVVESEVQGQFERWFAEVERAAAEKAWSVGHAAGRDYQGDGWNSDAHDPEEDNPYRAALGLTAEQEGEDNGEHE